MSKKAVADAVSAEPHISEKDLAALRADLGRLNHIEPGLVAPGLGDRVVAYVAEGEGDGVLHELTLVGITAVKIFNDERFSDAGLRRKSLLERDAWEPALIYRFGAVLAAIESGYWTQGADDRALRWLRLVCDEANNATANRRDKQDVLLKPFLCAATLLELVEAGGENATALVNLLYGHNNWSWNSYAHSICDLKEFLAGNVVAVEEAATVMHVGAQKQLAQDIGRLGLAEPYLDALFRWAIVSSPKSLRGAAQAALTVVSPDLLTVKAAAALAKGKTDARRLTVDLIAALASEQAGPLLTAHLESEKAKPVRDAITGALARLAAAPVAGGDCADGEMRAIDGSLIEIQPVPPLPDDTPLPPEALEEFIPLIAPFNAAVEKHNVALNEYYAARKWSSFHPEPLIDEETGVDDFLARMNGQGGRRERTIALMMGRWAVYTLKWDQAPLKRLLARPDFTLWHLLRLVSADVTGSGWSALLGRLNETETPEKTLRAKMEEGLDFRLLTQMQAMLGDLARPADASARGALYNAYWNYLYVDLDWPSLPLYFLEHLDLLEEALGMRPKSGEGALNEKAALDLLAWLPKIPTRLLNPLLDLAVGPRKQVRAPARALLASAVGIDDAIIARLSDAKKEIRATAAEWLAQRGVKQAVPALNAALKKEQSEEGRAAYLTALSRLGEDISGHFSQKALKAEAEKGLPKLSAKSLEWFPYASLPRLEWSDGGEVDPVVVKWWIGLADMLKDPAGNALFELYLDRLKPEHAERLGLFLLQAFIERDTGTCTEEEANEYAKERADRRQQWWEQRSQQDPEWGRKYPFNYEQAFVSVKAEKLRQHIHSCSDNRGVLGLTMRAPGPDSAALTRRYLKDHGQKVNQSKALLTALARNPAPAAIQAVLAVSNRHKQKTVQALAKELIDGIAEQRGWTSDELADRTIPDSGFDETGEMELDCGEGRTFRAVYRGDGKIELLNPDGKAVKALPAIRNDADKEPVGAAKKALSNARKEVKQVETMQTQRLYEAMCVGRSWTPEIWTSCLERHPIVGRLCQRLVWLALDAEGVVVASFRPTEDGGLTDNADETVELEGAAALRLAHQALLPDAESEAWLAHFGDYEVASLFTQFGRTFPSLDDEQKAAVVIDDRKGWMIDNLKLQSAAAKLGYERGEVSDGAGFYEYVKRFEGAALRAVIAFSGSYVGANESFACALHGLSFERIGAKGRGGKALTLAETPPVLLTEAWADFHAVAAAGSGFAPDWEKKSYF
jgi:hypothetical protein